MDFHSFLSDICLSVHRLLRNIVATTNSKLLYACSCLFFYVSVCLCLYLPLHSAATLNMNLAAIFVCVYIYIYIYTEQNLVLYAFVKPQI